MPPAPKFTEMQAVRLLPPEKHTDWPDGIIVDSRWEEAGAQSRTGEPYEARWIYEVQIGDEGDTTDLWFTEDTLEAK